MSNALTVKERILKKGEEFGVNVAPTPLDQFAGAITYLAGDDCHPDEVEMTLVRLMQGNHIEAEEAQDLLIQYLSEVEASR